MLTNCVWYIGIRSVMLQWYVAWSSRQSGFWMVTIVVTSKSTPWPLNSSVYSWSAENIVPMIRCTPMAVYSPLSMKHTRTLKSQCSCHYNYAPKIVRAAAHSVFLYLMPVSYSAGNKQKYCNHCKEYLTIHGQDKTRQDLTLWSRQEEIAKETKCLHWVIKSMKLMTIILSIN